MLPQNHNIDMIPQGVPIVVNVSQYDVGREINFYLYNGSEAYAPATGSTIRIEGTKPDNTGFSYSASYVGNKVTVQLTDQMTVLEGEVKCELRVTEGGSDVGSLNFILMVEKAALPSDIPISETEIPAIILLARAEQYNAEAWAVGQRNGVDVPSTDPTYHNNSKYWSEHSQTSSLAGLSDVELTTPSTGQTILYNAINDKWENGDVSTTTTLAALTDTSINNPSNGQIIKYNGTSQKWENTNAPSGGGLLPHLYIDSEVGSTVTVVAPDSTVITPMQMSSGHWECDVDDYGVYTIHSILNGLDATLALTVDSVKEYQVTDNHFSYLLSVYAPSGATIRVTATGETYTNTGEGAIAVVFGLHQASTEYTIQTNYNGAIRTVTITTPSTTGGSGSVAIDYASIVVTYGNDFRGETIICTDGVTTYTETAPNDGNTVTFTIPNTGTWTISSEAGGVPYSVTKVVSAYTSYTVTLEVFSATVTIMFPYSNGATCSISDGDTTLTATESPMAFNIPNTGTWVATCTLDGQNKTQSFSITTDGQTESHTFEYGTINLTYANEFRGLSLSCSSGGTTITKTAPATGNSMVFYPPSTGTWTITGVYSGTTYSSGNITVSSLSTAVSATIQTLATITVTIYGAKQDTITFTDAAGTAHTVTFASGQTSKSETLKVNPTGTTNIVFTSSVSKNPTNLSQNYSKTIGLTPSSTTAYVMPDKVLYWYGNQVNITTTTYGGVFTYTAPTWNAQNATVTLSGKQKDCHFVASTAVTTTKAHCIVTPNVSGGTNADLYIDSTYTRASASSNPTYVTHTGSGAPILICSSGSTTTTTSTITLYALWYD